ncbi:MAG TPA: HlyC/CorC family transporter [Hypericibacter adhaerens]|uniref:Membrane protein n=1 Tax=Hypericibacter adhaerens TaxID=2602016 RepID=A0A5J6N606_9PROT|nr:HlyC/CorC family transporter [Hypericibacter adhaerens]QEX24325.1 membrane protein [Hypericibacter adhaerens]HWA43011.1 HlyC/CorC family transporter [Hypericibacter adhaerens]
MFGAILAILFLLCCSAFFAGAETALTAASRPRMHALAQENNRRALIVNELRTRMEQVIAALLLGNNLVNITASALATSVLIEMFGEHGVIYATAGMTVLVVLFGEVLPKTIAINNPDRTALGVAPPMRIFVAVATPVTTLIGWVVRGTMRLFGARLVTELGRDQTEEELRGAIDLHTEAAQRTETATELQEAGAMMHSILDLGQVMVLDIMVHRRNVTMIDADQPPAETVAQVLASPHTRIPIYQGNPDNIVGVLHAKALLRAVRAEQQASDKVDVRAIAAKPWFIPSTTTLLAQLRAFRERREHFALVVDEYGALLGIVTLEDILEEIVGEIDDEHDIRVRGLRKTPDGSIEVEGQVTIRDLNRQLGWKLPDEDASTIAGLVLHEARRIPEVGQVFMFHGCRFEVLERQRNRIKRLRIRPLAPATEVPAEAANA